MKSSMKKADIARLKKHPRYQEIKSAHERMAARVAAAEQEIAAARAEFFASAPEVEKISASAVAEDVDRSLFEALRPRGASVRVRRLIGDTMVAEIEDVSPTQVTLVGWSESFGLARGYVRGGYNRDFHLELEDLVKIQAGLLKGLRQKDWPKS